MSVYRYSRFSTGFPKAAVFDGAPEAPPIYPPTSISCLGTIQGGDDT